MPNSNPPQYLKNYNITIRVTFHEDDALRRLAQRIGMTLSDFLRSAAIIAATDHNTPLKFATAKTKAFSKCPEIQV